MKLHLATLLLCLSGCVSNNCLGSAAVADNTVYGLSRIRLGMTEQGVLKILQKPYKRETITIGEDVYDVWFYISRPTALGQSRLVPLNLTPVTFENGVLVGWGFDYYHSILNQKKKGMSTPAPVEELPKEDHSIEKDLQEINHQKVPPSGSPSLREAFLPSKDHPPIPGQVSMSSKPPQGQEAEASESPLNDEDERMLDDENEQNFDFY